MLESLAIRESTYKLNLEMKPKTDILLRIATSWYLQAEAYRRTVTRRLSLEEFQHCVRLMIARRLQDVLFEERGTRPHARVQAPLPRPLRVPQPIWDFLKCLGTYEHAATKTRYLPIHPLPDAPTTDACGNDYLLDVAYCTAQDWTESWTRALAGRAKRLHDSIEPTNPLSKLRSSKKADLYDLPAYDRKHAELLLTEVRRMTSISNGIIDLEEPLADGTYESDKLYRLDGEVYKVKEGKLIPAEEAEYRPQLTLNEAINKIRESKFDRQYPSSEDPTALRAVQMDIDETVDQGQMGEWLGWDFQLWRDWEQFITHMDDCTLTSLSFPKDGSGNIAWLLDSSFSQVGKHFIKAPTSDIKTADIAMAILIQTSTWHLYSMRKAVANWFVESSHLCDLDGTTFKWLEKSFKLPITAAPAYC